MFNFRLINTPDGNQIIDYSLKTPYSSMTPFQMLEYVEADHSLGAMEIVERRLAKEKEIKEKEDKKKEKKEKIKEMLFTALYFVLK